MWHREQFGGIDILVNNAAIFHGMRYETLLDVDLDYYYQIMKVNMHSPLVMTRAVAGSMAERWRWERDQSIFHGSLEGTGRLLWCRQAGRTGADNVPGQ